MEYGLRPASLESDFRGPADLGDATLRRLCPDAPVTALYFGSEFCQSLLPTARTAEAFCRLAQRRGLDAVLLTPVLTHQGLRRLGRLLDRLTSRSWSPAVVCNDWGALELLRRGYPRLLRRLGRLMNRGLRDPRLDMQPAGRGREPLQRGSGIRRLAAALGVSALESDADLMPGYLGNGADGLQRALHLPFTFAASGRNCLEKASATHVAFARTIGSGCPAPCREVCRRERRRDCGKRVWRAGNTVFFETPPDWMARHILLADRVVLHERPLP